MTTQIAPNDKHLIWSDTTNINNEPIKSRVYIKGTNRAILLRLPSLTISTQHICVATTSTNLVKLFRPQQTEKYLELRMYNSNGIEVPLSYKGKQLGQRLNLPGKSRIRSLKDLLNLTKVKEWSPIHI